MEGKLWKSVHDIREEKGAGIERAGAFEDHQLKIMDLAEAEDEGSGDAPGDE